MYRFAVAAIAAGLLLPVAAGAAPASLRVQAAAVGGVGVKAVMLQYDDQDLSSSAGATALLARIGKAAEAVCSSRSASAGQIAQCQKDAVNHAVGTVNSPALTQAAASK